MRPLRLLAVIVPVVCAALPLGTDPPPPLPPPPVAHAVDIWMGHADAVGTDPRFEREAERERLFPSLPRAAVVPHAATLGGGFAVVGSVAVLQGDEATVGGVGNRPGIEYKHLAEISTRFIQAFGDDYDQIAVFLAFTDYNSAQSLAYQMRVKNDVTGIMLRADGKPDLFDATDYFGSKSGRMSTVLNMKRILAYGRGAADNPENDLYAVWAQEAAHRWSAYLRFRRATDTENSDALLGRQLAHWAKGVQADGSIMDGYLWRDNKDGTFTAVERDKRYGTLDQYAMGLLPAKDVPPFFLLEEIRRATDDVLIDKGFPLPGANYKARKVDLTINDVIRAMGAREPATDPAAADMRMGVVLLTQRDVTPDQVVGESYRIDRTRRLWDGFYNEAGGGRGKVCTELMRPCRGLSLTYGAPVLTGSAKGGTPAPGQTFTLEVPVTNAGDAAGTAQVRADGGDRFVFNPAAVSTGMLDPGQEGTLKFSGRVPLGAPCGQLLPVDFTTVEKPGRASPSKGSATLLIGATPGPREDLESAAGWMVNPDGTDTAATGKWELGTPEHSDVFEFVVQPSAAWSGMRAFVTGAPKGMDSSANDVSGPNGAPGRTTLQSPALSLAGLEKPRLSYQVYFVAADFQNEVLVPAANDALVVQASADGKTWTEVDRVTGMSLGWQRRVVKLEDRLPAGALGADLRFRFVAEDADVNTVVEATVDDVALFGEAAACSIPAPDGGAGTGGTGGIMGPPDPAGCNCRVGSRGDAPLALLPLLALLLLRRRRRP
jgi:MYXO-CTERM domain-containing protein